MRRFILPLLLSALLPISGCSGAPAASAPRQEDGLTVLATTYPVYLLACAVTDGVGGVTVERLNTGSVNCLHDYTLSVTDMKKIEGAGVIAMNGAGLEDFMDDALASSAALVVNCSQGVDLLENLEHDHQAGDEDHDHGHWDSHYWMDPANAAIMAGSLAQGLAQADPEHEQAYRDNAQIATVLLNAWDASVRDILTEASQSREDFGIPGLITFHDGFQYFARAYDLPLLASIEEEEGSEASAQEILEITRLVQDHQIPVIFTEVNGSDATANAIARETGCAVAQLTMLMDGPDDGRLSNYLDGLMGNVTAIVNGFAGEELVR